MKKILVIEDEPQVRENIQEILTLSNFDAVTAPDGASGLQMAQHTTPDLIICDIMMPEMDGYHVLEGLRLYQATATIPLIFLTAKSDYSSLRQGMEGGANDYLTKPFEPDELLRVIHTQLDKQERVQQQTQAQLGELSQSITLSLPHELNTPLNGIIGMCELLIFDPAIEPEETFEIAQAIKSSALRLHRLAQNFLLHAELELLKHHPAKLQSWRNCPPISVKSIISQVAYEKAHQVERTRDLGIEIREVKLAISEAHLRKLIEELIDNAFKFSPMGTPVWVRGDTDTEGFHLQVIDMGRGMTPEQIRNLGAYMQFDRSVYEQQGAGLGLTIAKQLAEVYGGQLTIESTLGQRTCIHLILPNAG
jgi:two-component system sensor histidine kinase/response regulator